MEILIVTNDYPDPVNNWTGTAIQYPAQCLAKEHKVRIIRRTPWPDWKVKGTNRLIPKQSLDKEIEVYYLRSFYTPLIFRELYGIWYFLSLYPLIKKLHTRRPIDLILAFFIYPDGFASVLSGKFFKIPVITISRGSDINLFLKHSLIRKLITYTINNSHKTIAVSQDIQKKLYN